MSLGHQDHPHSHQIGGDGQLLSATSTSDLPSHLNSNTSFSNISKHTHKHVHKCSKDRASVYPLFWRASFPFTSLYQWLGDINHSPVQVSSYFFTLLILQVTNLCLLLRLDRILHFQPLNYLTVRPLGGLYCITQQSIIISFI